MITITHFTINTYLFNKIHCHYQNKPENLDFKYESNVVMKQWEANENLCGKFKTHTSCIALQKNLSIIYHFDKKYVFAKDKL